MRNREEPGAAATRRAVCVGASSLALYAPLAHVHAGDHSDRCNLDTEALSRIVFDEIAAGRIPGAVILIGKHDEILWRAAFGHRVLGAAPVPMTPDTIFDLASLTKPVATATAVLHLADARLITLDEPASRYWAEFGQQGKATITIRQLLTHYSGLAADMDLSQGWTGYDTAMRMVASQTPIASPGDAYLYSDIGYLALGEIVQRVTATPFDAYCTAHIFAPLKMTDTLFRPTDLRRVAPTQDIPGHPHWGDVHDATTRWMGGVSGSAGLFSTADDLGRYLRMLLAGGASGDVRVLSRRAARQLVTTQTPRHASHPRGLGWDIGAPEGLFPEKSFGHLGYTGGMMWASLQTRLWIIALTHRVYPDGRGDATPLRRALVTALSSP